MLSVLWDASIWRRTGLVTACLALIVTTQLTGAGKSPMRVLKYDPAAEKIDLFDGLKSGSLAVRVVAHDVNGGNIFVENLTKKPLTVDLPDAVAMVHVLKQVGNNGFAQFGNSLNSSAQQNGMGLGQMGSGQSLGSGFGQQQGMSQGLSNQFGNGQNQGNANGFFSIPPERTAQVPYQSVCLDYGKPDPSPRMIYRPVKLEEFTTDKVLQETIREFGRGKLKQKAAQAACWHLTDKLSWDKLASLRQYTLPGVFTSQVPTFQTGELKTAKELVSSISKRVADEAKAETQPESKRRVSQVTRTRR